jgi:hypothetical protein
VQKFRRALFLALFLPYFAATPAVAGETVFDAISLQSDSTLANYFALENQNYGFGFIPGESREINALEILVNRSQVSGKVIARIYQNSSNGFSGTGIFVAEFTQTASTSPYTGGVSNAHLLRLVGSAQVTSGLKYWVYFRAVSFSGNEANSFGKNSPTVSNGWQMILSGGSFLVTSVGASFTYSSYPIARIILSTPTTIQLSISGGSSLVRYRTPTTIQATVNSDGPVTFYANGKKIPGCVKKRSSAGVASCSWKASTHSQIALTARVTPTDSVNYAPQTSAPLTVQASKRTGTR